MTYTRKMQSGIHAMIADIAKHTGHRPDEVMEYFKSKYWGDRVGHMSLSLDKCKPYDAQSFYELILDFALEMQIEFCTWTDDP